MSSEAVEQLIDKIDNVIAQRNKEEAAKRRIATVKARYGDDFYIRIGRKGGQNSTTGGFAANPELARMAGQRSRRKAKEE